jgi:rRNA processing protein Krr1/Pno1
VSKQTRTFLNEPLKEKTRSGLVLLEASERWTVMPTGSPATPLYFLTARAVALAIAWATVFAHAVRLARANPIHALRYE